MGEAADVVRLAFERFNRGEIDAFVALFSKRVRFHEVPEIPGARTYDGPDGVREWVAKVTDASADLRLEPWEHVERGDAVMVETSAETTGRGSGAALGWRYWTVWRVKDGLITYHHGYSGREDALADLEGREAAEPAP